MLNEAVVIKMPQIRLEVNRLHACIKSHIGLVPFAKKGLGDLDLAAGNSYIYL